MRCNKGSEVLQRNEKYYKGTGISRKIKLFTKAIQKLNDFLDNPMEIVSSILSKGLVSFFPLHASILLVRN